MYKKHQIETYSELKENNLLNYLLEWAVGNARDKFFDIFKKKTQYSKKKSIIDIGTTPSLRKIHNSILSKVKKNNNVTCLSNLNCKSLSKKYTNIKKFIQADARKNNLSRNSFDIVHSNATIEHVGSYKNQLSFVKECVRISKKYVFIQTPNRFFPIDFHTFLPFIHWLPKSIHRKILKGVGLSFYSYEKNLNLLSKKDLINFCKNLDLKNFEIIKYKLFLMTSNLILIIKK
jgi:ubiquinone/menaquinone biosynthesis C-methylase UbiE